jgi:hypothetical protein
VLLVLDEQDVDGGDVARDARALEAVLMIDTGS